MWVGDRARGLEPWRDTGVEIRGPAVADVVRAFAETWAATGSPLPADERPAAADLPQVGDVALRVVAGTSFSTGTFRLDTLVAALARRTLWLTDAYYAGTSIYVQALRAAAEDGVDVRLLVPGGTDIAVVQAVSRAGYRALLEAGVRVFEWNGSMLHAKTAVADGRWSRVGSTNLNVASWLGNWELDVVVEDERFGARLEEMYLGDLEDATEIVLEAKGRGRRAAGPPRRRPPRVRGPRGSAGRATAGALRLGHAVGAAITRRRPLGPAEAGLMLAAGLLLLAVAAVAYLWPVAIAVPVIALATWMGTALVVRAVRLWHEHRSRRGDASARGGAPR
jgi:cardiolipin synthase